MKKKFFRLFVIVGILLIIGLIIYNIYPYFSDRDIDSESSGKRSGSGKSGTPGPNPCDVEDSYQAPDFSSLKTKLENQAFVKNMPKKGSVRLRFFHFKGRCRVWDRAYFLTTNSVEEKNVNGDFDIWIHSDYVSKLNNENLCDVIAEARAKGDLGSWTELGKVELVWRYKSMLGYKDCIGIDV